MKIEEKLLQMGIELPKAPAPVANYVPAKRTGNLLFVSGQACGVDGVMKYQGKVGEDLTIEEGYEAARLCIINALAILKEELGDLDRVKQVVKLFGLVASAPEFYEQPKVMNGASDLLANVFGENGKHARSAIGTNTLPFNTPVEVELIVEIE